jgi:cell division protein FtsL
MEANKNRYQNNNIYYMEGNAARQLQEIPSYPQNEDYDLEQQRVREIRRKPHRSVGIDVFSLLILTMAIGLTFYTCIEYLSVQTGITRMDKQIAGLESDLTKMQNENNAALSSLNTSLDLNYIYQVATTELGMVYPNENQVITYQSTLSDYVRQYEEIPEESSIGLLEGILR